MRASVASALTFVVSALAIAVTFPKEGDSWSASGPNTLRWTTVASDPSTFDVYLVSQDQKTQQKLNKDPVSSGLGTTNFDGPFPQGVNWTVNLMSLPTTQNQQPGILAQSSQITINSTSINGHGTSAISASGSRPTTMSGATNTAIGGLTTGTATLTGADANLNPTGNPSSASGFFQVSSGLVALAAAIHFVL